jgi:hypothetical protein
LSVCVIVPLLSPGSSHIKSPQVLISTTLPLILEVTLISSLASLTTTSHLILLRHHLLIIVASIIEISWIILALKPLISHFLLDTSTASIALTATLESTTLIR